MRDNTFLAIVAVFAPLSLMSVGGGQSIMPAIQSAVVAHHWLTSAQFIDDYAISRAMPGPTSLIVALIGWQVAGIAGAIVGCIAIFLPSSLLVYGLANIWRRHKGRPWQIAIERGLAPIAAGLVLSSSISVLRNADGGTLRYVVAALSLLATMRTRVHPLMLIGAGGLIFLVAGALELPIGANAP